MTHFEQITRSPEALATELEDLRRCIARLVEVERVIRKEVTGQHGKEANQR